MAAPTAPYTTSAKVAFLLRQLLQGDYAGGFGADTDPTVTEVDQYITWVAAEMNVALATFGLVIPLAKHPDDAAWDSTQTDFLDFLNALGAAEHAHSALKPLGTPGRTGTQDSDYKSKYATILGRVRGGRLELRANYRAGTRAERQLAVPQGPRNEFRQGAYDPTKYESLLDYTKRMQSVRAYMEDFALYWNFMYPVTATGPAV